MMTDPADSLLALDVGGTFTDVILVDRKSGEFTVAKTPSVPAAPARGFFSGVDRVLADAGAGPADIASVLHGSTIVTNAILENTGARSGLVTTAGFRHVLEIGRAEIPRAANLFSWVKPERPVRARHIFEVPGRIRLDGSEAVPLDEAALDAVADAIGAAGLDTVAVVLLHSYANPDHERRVGARLRARLPDIDISLSVDVLPVFREYERTVATTLNARVQPVVARYVRELAAGLERRAIGAPLLLMKSNGGTCPPAEAARAPVSLALSGPAAGTAGAAWLGRLAGFPDLLTIDMGGTSADVGLVRGNEPVRTTAGGIGHHPLSLPMIDIHTIGAGGGSIASVTDEGGIRVGPESAGADPGPACYGAGATRPTVTDANLVLGRIPASLLDGEVALDFDAAERAIDEHVARPLNTSAGDAALGIIDLVNASMTGALKVMSVERGLDPIDFALSAFGGAGPVHAAMLMRSLGTGCVMVPRHPGIMCAIGLLATDLRYDFAVTRLQRAGDIDPVLTGEVLDDLGDQADRRLTADGIPPERRLCRRAADMRYAHQGVELTVGLADGPVTAATLEALVEDFHALHRRLYTFSDPSAPVEIVTLRLEASGTTGEFALPEVDRAASPKPEPATERRVRLDGRAGAPVPVYRRTALCAGHEIFGPAIIEQFDSTAVILDGQEAMTDRYGTLVIRERASRERAP
ncbi:MAG: hydantoinase/oxoprolinase family protein [Alphaproteobacteria bacterium]|nr:hydantoinase/oxoprolinase family protein [Alphaproteobacteria bacterium]